MTPIFQSPEGDLYTDIPEKGILRLNREAKSREQIIEELEALDYPVREMFEKYEGLNPPMKGHWE